MEQMSYTITEGIPPLQNSNCWLKETDNLVNPKLLCKFEGPRIYKQSQQRTKLKHSYFLSSECIQC